MTSKSPTLIIPKENPFYKSLRLIASPVMVSPLFNIPLELLRKILSHVQDQTALYQLCQCSRLLHDLTIPYLFRDVEIKHRKESGRYQDCNLYQTTYDFTVLILREPQRARLVKRFTMSRFDCAYSHTPKELVQTDIQLFVRRAPWCVAYKPGWLKDILETENLDALLTVLIPLLPRLEHLEIGISPNGGYWNTMLLEVMTRRGDSLPETALTRLRHLTAFRLDRSPWDCIRQPCIEQSGIWPDQLAHFLRMRSMRSIEGRLCIDATRLRINATTISIGPSWELASLDHASSAVQSLVLKIHFFDFEDVTSAVAACRDLKELKLELLRPFFRLDELAALVAATMQASQSLETLSLTYRWPKRAEEWLVTDDLDQGRISLTDFPKLRHVTLSIFFIFGARMLVEALRDNHPEPLGDETKTLSQCLPPHIETLRIVLCEEKEAVPLPQNVEFLLRSKRDGSFPSLRLVTLDYTPLSQDRGLRGQELPGIFATPDVPRQLGRLAADVGAEFQTIFWSRASL